MQTLKYAIMQGVFVSISATTNGGLDITGKSLIPYAHDYFVQAIVIFLIILGSIGFPVLLEVKAMEVVALIFIFHYLLKLRHQHIYSYYCWGL